MKEFRIANFKYGLDTRREQLTAQPGTLVTAENCHINPGGEAQKRLAFVENADLGVLDTLGDQGTFGLDNVGVGKITFGSALPFTAAYVSTNGVATTNLTDGTATGCTLNTTAVNGIITSAVVNNGGTGGNYNVGQILSIAGGALFTVATDSGNQVATVTVLRGQSQSQPILLSTMPAGYTYQQLKHPALTDSLDLDGLTGANTIVYDRTKHRITSVIFSNSYKGSAFVGAIFADGNSFLFYSGVMIRQSGSGVVWNSFTTTSAKNNYIIYQIGKQFEALAGWGNGTALVDPKPVDGGNLVSKGIGSPPSTTFTMTDTVVSGGGWFGTTVGLSTTNVAASGSSTASFTVAGGGGKTYKLNAAVITGQQFQISGQLALFNLMSPDTITWGTDNNTTAAAIAAAVNLLTSVHGYSAISALAVVTVTSTIPSTPTLGTFTPTFPLVVVSTDATANGSHAFSTAVYSNAFGQRGNVWVDSTAWTTGDSWSIAVSDSVQGNITIGKGNISGNGFINSLKLGQREFLAFGQTFAYSAVGDPTGWEEQNIGAGFDLFTSEFGGQDTVQAFSHMQGRLAVFGTQSIQMWTVDADPNNFALTQTIDNIGTIAPFSVQSIGDVDSYFLDSSGYRSLKPKEVTLNAYPDDVGIAIDLTVRAALVGYDPSRDPSVIEPLTRQYWDYLNGSIYVFSNYPTSKVMAWSVYKPTYDMATVFLPFSDHYDGSGNSTYASLVGGNTYVWTKGVNDTSLTVNGVTYTTTVTFVYDGVSTATIIGAASQLVTASLVQHVQTSFVPTKFVVFNKQVYVRADNNKVYLYGGTDGNTYDRCLPTVELPFLSIGDGSMRLKGMGVDATIKGNWDVYASMNPRGTLTKVIENKGSGTSPDSLQDSTYDTGHYTYASTGTHFKLKAIGGPYPINMKLSSLTFLYDTAGIK